MTRRFAAAKLALSGGPVKDQTEIAKRAYSLRIWLYHSAMLATFLLVGLAITYPRSLINPYDVRTMTLVRTQRLELRLTDGERQLDSAAATAVGETLSDFFRRAASARAQEVLADQQRIVLSEDEAARFLDALDAVDRDTVARLRELRERA